MCIYIYTHTHVSNCQARSDITIVIQFSCVHLGVRTSATFDRCKVLVQADCGGQICERAFAEEISNCTRVCHTPTYCPWDRTWRSLEITVWGWLGLETLSFGMCFIEIESIHLPAKKGHKDGFLMLPPLEDPYVIFVALQA